MTTERRLGVDVGGTFTDLVLSSPEGILTAKVPTTPDQSDGVVTGGHTMVDGTPAVALVHGTTIATNAVLERSGVRTALITDAGFEDVIEIGRQDRPSLYDPAVTRPAPLVTRQDRIGFDGDVDVVAARVREMDPASVAVCLAYSYVDPGAERAIASALRDRAVSLSSVVAPEFREFERTSTTVMNAYLEEVVSSYLSRLGERAGGIAERLTVMRSSGGLIGVDEASSLAVSLLLSGPAGGVMAAAALGGAHGFPTMITFDMGGTSTDVCRIDDGRPELVYQRFIEGYSVRMPSVAVHTVGAGGGSIAWIDGGGSLRVGPHSAGSVPGPVCYGGGGTDPTVTDANLVLGRIPADVRLGGELGLDIGAAHGALTDLGQRLGLDTMATARGIIAVVDSHMERAIRAVSIEQGIDPAGAVLVAFGGAGGLHAGSLARGLGMSKIVVPPHAGVFSALGLVMSPPRLDVSRSIHLEDPGLIAPAMADLVAAARRRFAATHGGRGGTVRTLVDVRYRGQAHELTIETGPGLVERFHIEHERRNGFCRPDDPVEIVTLRVEVVDQPALTWADVAPPPVTSAPESMTPLELESGIEMVPLYDRGALAPGFTTTGTAVIVEDIGTTLVPPHHQLEVLPDGTIAMSSGTT